MLFPWLSKWAYFTMTPLLPSSRSCRATTLTRTEKRQHWQWLSVTVSVIDGWKSHPGVCDSSPLWFTAINHFVQQWRPCLWSAIWSCRTTLQQRKCNCGCSLPYRTLKKRGKKAEEHFHGLIKKRSVLQQSALEDVFKWTQSWEKQPASFDMKKMKINKTTTLLDIVLLTSLSIGLYWNSENGAKISTSEAKIWAFSSGKK